MRQLLDHLNSLPKREQAAFAKNCGTTMGYLRKAISVGQRLSAETCIHIERESGGGITCEYLRPDVPWCVLRKPAEKLTPALASQAQAAINSEAQEGTHA